MRRCSAVIVDAALVTVDARVAVACTKEYVNLVKNVMKAPVSVLKTATIKLLLVGIDVIPRATIVHVVVVNVHISSVVIAVVAVHVKSVKTAIVAHAKKTAGAHAARTVANVCVMVFVAMIKQKRAYAMMRL